MTIKKIIIGTLILLFVVVVIVITNQATLKCKNNDGFDETQQLCFYDAPSGVQDCLAGMKYNENKCYYQKQGIITSTIIIIFICIAAFIGLIYIMYIVMQRNLQKQSMRDIVYREWLDWDEDVKPIFQQIWAEEYKLPMIDNKPDDDNFIYKRRRNYSDKANGRRYMRIEFECINCENVDGNGCFLLFVPMAKEKNEDLKKLIKSHYSVEKGHYATFRRPSYEPLELPKSKEDILMSMINSSDTPEEVMNAIRLQRQLMSSMKGMGTDYSDQGSMLDPSNISNDEYEELSPYDRLKYNEAVKKGKKFKRRS